MDSTNKTLFKEESFKIIGACMKVDRSLGAGFLRRFTGSIGERIPHSEHLKTQVKLPCVTITSL
jgi:hypothetical protein